MYEKVCKEQEASMFKKPNIIDSDAKRKAAIESNKKIITEYVGYLDKKIRKEIDHDYFAPKNVMEALKEEAKRKCNDDWGEVREYMKHQLHTVREQAHLWGPSALDYDVRPFNAWCLNPNCVNDLSEEERDDLFGDPNCDLSPGNFAVLLISEFVSPFEIVRINEVLMCRTLNWLSDLHRNAYEYIVKKFQFSIHLDKRWDSLLPEPEILHNELPL